MSRRDEERAKFLKRHRDADYIEVDTRLNAPVRAIYHSYEYSDIPEVRTERERIFWALVREKMEQEDGG